MTVALLSPAQPSEAQTGFVDLQPTFRTQTPSKPSDTAEARDGAGAKLVGEIYTVANEDSSIELDATVETDQLTGVTTIHATGAALVGEDKKPVKVTMSVKVEETGETTVTMETRGAVLSDEESEALLAGVSNTMATDLSVSADINRETYEGLLGISDGASTPISSAQSSPGVRSISATHSPSTEGVTLDARIRADTNYERSKAEGQKQLAAVGGDTRRYNGGGAGSSTSADDGVIKDAALNGLASNSDFKYRSQGNVEGNYFSKTDQGIMATVSTADRRPGFWNGNRAEIAFNKKFRSSDTTGFRSFFDIHAGSNFSIFQLFNQSGKEGFPEAMVKVVDGKLVLGGRAFGGKDIVLGTLPEGKFGIDVKFSGGKVSVQLLDASGESVGSGYTAALTQPGGEFHYRAGPYFDGHNNKQFGGDMKNVTAKVEIIDPTMIG
jgi:hypothetical protein